MITAGTTVEGGYYLNRDAWDLIAVSGKQGVLPGVQGERYIRLPALAVLALAPMAGGLFVVFLPLIGFALVSYYAARAVWVRGQRLFGKAKRSRTPPAQEVAKPSPETTTEDQAPND